MKARLFAIGLDIALLLPLAVYTGVNIYKPPPDWSTFYNGKYDQRRQEAETKAAKQQIEREEKEQQKKLDNDEREYQKCIFYVSFPVGMLAVIVGTVLKVRAVGSGLMFGGIILLAGGCYSYWDKMTTLVRFLSVLVALGVFIGLGYRCDRSETASINNPAQPPEPDIARGNSSRTPQAWFSTRALLSRCV